MSTNQPIFKGFWAAGCVIALTLMWNFYQTPSLATAHGTDISYALQSTVVVQANFDTGEPMAEAQISVFDPSDPSTVWLQGMTDENGTFMFAADPQHSGTYDVRVRVAGHGEIITVPISGGPIEAGGASRMQQLIMAGAVIWGFVGTALYFSARNQDRSSANKSEGNQDYAHT